MKLPFIENGNMDIIADYSRTNSAQASPAQSLAEWCIHTAQMVDEQGYRVVPVFADASTKPYAADQTYLQAEDYRNAAHIAAVMDDAILLDWDGNKGKPLALDALAAKLGLDAMPAPAQENTAGDSLHFLFRRPASVSRDELKASADGWLPHIDLKTGNQLMHLKPHKIINDGELPRLSELPEAPAALVDALRVQTMNAGGEQAGGTAEDWVNQLLEGESLHGSALKLSMRWVRKGWTDTEILGYFEGVAPRLIAERGPGRVACLMGNEIKRMVSDARRKVEQDDTPSSWPDLADPFAEQIVPAFPLDILPAAFEKFSREKSAQSGFDPGGYAFCLLVAAANTIDHRARLDLGPFAVPAFVFAGLAGDSGSGKSPIINEATRSAEAINNDIVRESNFALAAWHSALDAAKGTKSEPPPKPVWKQRHALDTTTEALGQLLVDNPEGINLYHHEITEWLGRMDAYSKDGAKDRGVFLRSYDGGPVTINRISRGPLVVPDFSVGILAGIQPEVLAEKFRKAGTGADGLYQRFSLYRLRAAGSVNYLTKSDPLTDQTVRNIFNFLHQQCAGKPLTVSLSYEAIEIMQMYHNDVRKLAQRTPARRFAEHLDKFPGMLGRFAFALHVLTAVETGADPLRLVEGGTMDRARRLMGCLYRHSEAVYSVLDQEAGQVRALVRSAAEAILAKRWECFKRGDLTRNATYWKSADNRDAEGAIDYLIELGWVSVCAGLNARIFAAVLR